MCDCPTIIRQNLTSRRQLQSREDIPFYPRLLPPSSRSSSLLLRSLPASIRRDPPLASRPSSSSPLHRPRSSCPPRAARGDAPLPPERPSALRGDGSPSSRLPRSRSSRLPRSPSSRLRSSPPRGGSAGRRSDSCRTGCACARGEASPLADAGLRAGEALEPPPDLPPCFLLRRRRLPPESESESEELLSLLLLLLLSLLLDDEESEDEELLSLSLLLLELGLGCWAASCACLSAMMRGISLEGHGGTEGSWRRPRCTRADVPCGTQRSDTH